MRAWIGLWIAMGCAGDAEKDTTDVLADLDADTDADTDADSDSDSDSDTDSDADTDSDTDADTGDTGTDPCGVDPSLAVTAFTFSVGIPDTMVELQVDLSAPAPVAAQCTSDLEPEEIFLVESTDLLDTHTLRLEGLVPLTDYTCTAAPVCPTLAGPAASLTYSTGTPPSDMRRLDVIEDPVLGMTGAWTLAPYRLEAFFGTTWLVIWGPEGRVRWWWPLPTGVGQWIEARHHPEEDGIVWGGGFASEGRPHVLDFWDGYTYIWSPPGWQNEEFHHDGKRIDDGRYMTLEIRENSAGNDTWDGFGIRVVDPVTGLTDFDFDSQSLVDSGQLEEGGGFFNSDPYHANWMEWAETVDGPEVYVSLCFSEQILAVSGVDGSFLWLLGENKGWTVIDDAGAPLPEDALPQCQHGLEVTGERQLLVYDNGQGRSVSSASEWLIDPDTRTAQRLWTWSEPSWQEDYLGDIDDLGNDRVLVTQASHGSVNEIVEVDRLTGDVASRMTFTGGQTYRAERHFGCDFFDSVRYCDDLATRYAELEPLLVGP